MEAKRSNMQHTTQYTSNGHRITTGSSKPQVTKQMSEISLTPSKAAEQTKLNGRKHPLDALSKLPSRQPTIERRSGLQEVDEEYLKQNLFRKPVYPGNSGLNDVNATQSQLNPQAAGQPSIPPTQAVPPSMPNQPTNQSSIRSQQPSYHQNSNNLPASYNQIQPQVQMSSGAVPVQYQQATTPINHNPVSAQQDFQKQMIQEHSTNNQGNPVQQSGQPSTVTTNHNLAMPATPEPEMCTTCPNCQTTIYLVRGAEMPQDMPPQALNSVGQQMVSDTAKSGSI